MRVRKRPVVVDAVRVRDLVAGERELPSWVSDAVTSGALWTGICRPDGDEANRRCVYVQTHEGVMRGDEDDWVIRGVEGELYPCKPSVFEATYERVEEQP